jgi:hypothetical protein
VLADASAAALLAEVAPPPVHAQRLFFVLLRIRQCLPFSSAAAAFAVFFAARAAVLFVGAAVFFAAAALFFAGASAFLFTAAALFFAGASACLFAAAAILHLAAAAAVFDPCRRGPASLSSAAFTTIASIDACVAACLSNASPISPSKSMPPSIPAFGGFPRTFTTRLYPERLRNQPLKRIIVFFVGFLKASRKHLPVSGGRL